MNTIIEIINKRGGMSALEKEGHFKIINKPYMDLNIDYIGTGPTGHPMIAVAHNYVQNGDVMADPDMQVEIVENELFPVTYQQDAIGLFQEVYQVGADGRATGIRLRLKKQLTSFLRMWGKNLKEQGFLVAAEKAVEQPN